MNFLNLGGNVGKHLLGLGSIKQVVNAPAQFSLAAIGTPGKRGRKRLATNVKYCKPDTADLSVQSSCNDVQNKRGKV